MSKVWLPTLGLMVLLLASLGTALAFGSESVTGADVLEVLASHLVPGLDTAPDPIAERIIWQLRMPRVLLAL
ncbi:MAG TPA: hypothetical protein VKP65_22325, partial [Rhodothermales bacterium]|nr:hypothetical protein [Rhodothermales bacterium]